MNEHTNSAPVAARGETPVRVDRLSRAFGIIALIGVIAITVLCLAVQFLRTDLNWITTSMSVYVKGPWGALVQAGFFAPVPGLALLGVGWYRTLQRRERSAVSVALFIAAAVALCFTAEFVADATVTPVTRHGEIHQWAAFATFVFVTTAMALQSWRLRCDPHWRRHFPSAITVAAVAIVYFWVYALFKPIPRGLGEKVVIALVLLWVWRAAWWLVRGRFPRASA